MQNALVTRMADLGGSTDLTLASGDISSSWSQDVMSVLADVSALDDWQLRLTGDVAAINGTTSDAEVLTRLTAKYPENWPGSLSGTIDVALTSLFLDPAVIDDLLLQFADCGPITQVNDPGPVGYGPEDPVLLSGTLSGTASRDALQAAVEDAADGRTVVIDAEVLNPTLCLIENYLPRAPSSDIDIAFHDGATGQNVPSGRFVVGQNPVIDVMIPADLTTGYLSVSVLDVSGNVFHLLPNIGRADNSVESLRANQCGSVPLRVAYALNEERPPGGIAFAVDGTSLGKSKILVLHSDAPLFRDIRPTTESAVGYAEALSEQAAATDNLIRSLDTRILTTAEP
jgi:serine/threonine-protein kinase